MYSIYFPHTFSYKKHEIHRHKETTSPQPHRDQNQKKVHELATVCRLHCTQRASEREKAQARERKRLRRERGRVSAGSHHNVVKEAVYHLKARRHAAVDSYEMPPIHGPSVRRARLQHHVCHHKRINCTLFSFWEGGATPSHLYPRKPPASFTSPASTTSPPSTRVFSPGSSLLPLSYSSVVALGYWSSVVCCCVAQVIGPVLLSYRSSAVFLWDRSDEAQAHAPTHLPSFYPTPSH